jgi:hypothetical protein
MATEWHMEGTLLGACSCDWGCPRSFDAPPTRGFCEGTYAWHIAKGWFGDVSLDGLSLAWVAKSPGPIHQGNVIAAVLTDEKANAAQRTALQTIAEGQSGGPWTIFKAVSVQTLGPHYVPFHWTLDGLASTVKAGDALEMELGPILNPVSGQAEEIYLDKPTGFTSKRLTLGVSKVFRVAADFGFDHSGKYGEYSSFAYSGQTPD